MPSSVAIIAVAAGPGSRLAAGAPKAFVDLAGEPILLHGLRAIAAAAAAVAIDRLVVVAPASHGEHARDLLAQSTWPWPVEVVAGGEQRQDSVRNGLDACPGTDIVVVHDAARPFLPAAVLGAVIDVASAQGAALAALPAVDTVKLVDEQRRIVSTPARQRVWLAQTPQAFRRELLLQAHTAAHGSPATDDAALVEALPAPVTVVDGDAALRKITTPEDLRWAEWMLESGQWPR